MDAVYGFLMFDVGAVFIAGLVSLVILRNSEG